MRKWIKYALFGLMMLVLIACQSANESSTTLMIEEDGLIIEITLIAEDDDVIEQRTNNEISYEALGVNNAEEAEEILGEFMFGYDTTDGITHQVDYQDDRVIETVVVDFADVDVDEASQLAGTFFEGDPSEGISLEATVEMMEELGFEVVD